jgi:hypothetical protein
MRCKVLLLASVVVIVIVGLAYFFAFEGNIYGFFRIGTYFPLSPYIDISDDVIVKGAGYDGHLFLAIALDPLLSHPDSLGALDNPRYRYRRILFPLLGYGLALGQRPAVPYMLVIINITAFIGLVGLMLKISGAYGKLNYAPLLLLAVPGLWVSQLLTTADLLGAFLLLLALYSYMNERYYQVAACYALAALTHETMVIVIGSLIIASFIANKRKEAFTVSLGIIPFVLWNSFVLVKIPAETSTTGIIENFSIPGHGILEKFITIFNHHALDAISLFDIFSFTLLLLSFVMLILHACHKQLRSVILPPALAYAGLFLIAKMQILEYYVGFLRVFSNVFIMTIVCIVMLKKINFPNGLVFFLSALVSLGIIVAFVFV